MTTPRLTLTDLLSAIVVDFEGRADRHPVLVGILDARVMEGATGFQQVVLDTRFAPIADAHGLPLVGIERTIARLVQRAERDDRILIGWSSHELDVVRAWCSPALARGFAARYRDARAISRQWLKRNRFVLPPTSARVERHALAGYLRLIGFRVPPVHGTGRTGTTIRVLESALERDPRFAALTRRRKARWTWLLRHNEHDCRGTLEVVRRAMLDDQPLGAVTS